MIRGIKIHDKYGYETWIVLDGIHKRIIDMLKNTPVKAVLISSLIESTNSYDLFYDAFSSLKKGYRVDTNEFHKLITQAEDQKLEFKSTLRYNLIHQSISKDLEKSVLKNICAFLNTNDGKLIIGLSDDNIPIGLKNDYSTLGNKDQDGFENHLTNIISSKMGTLTLKNIQIEFFDVNGLDLCQLSIKKMSKPVYYRERNIQEFWIKTGNSSRRLSMSEAHEYIREAWK